MNNKDLKVAVLGAGAMGCLFGGLLAEKGLNVTLIDVWKEHVEEINKNGLKMDGHGGDRFIKIPATSDPSTIGKVDAVIEANLKPYDILPLIPIMKNSGAIVTNWKNEPAEKGGNILASSNKILHNKILKLLKPFTKK